MDAGAVYKDGPCVRMMPSPEDRPAIKPHAWDGLRNGAPSRGLTFALPDAPSRVMVYYKSIRHASSSSIHGAPLGSPDIHVRAVPDDERINL